jgi:hypothetical protein
VTSTELLPFPDDAIADIARTWKIRDRGAQADLAELAERNGISFQEAQRLILSAAALTSLTNSFGHSASADTAV